jgi:hypothetical protein
VAMLQPNRPQNACSSRYVEITDSASFGPDDCSCKERALDLLTVVLLHLECCWVLVPQPQPADNFAVLGKALAESAHIPLIGRIM